METDHYNIDRFIKRAASDYKEKAPDNAWDSLNSHLSGRAKKRKLLLIRSFTTAAALFLAFLAGYQIAIINKNLPEAIKISTLKIELPIHLPELQPIEAEQTSLPSQKTTTQKVNDLSMKVKRVIINDLKQIAQKQVNFASLQMLNRDNSQRYILPSPPNRQFVISIPEIPSPPVIHENNNKKRSRWSFDGDVGPMLAYQNPGLAENYDMNTLSFERSSTESEPLSSYSGGLAVNYLVANNISFSTGIYYNRTGQQLNTNLGGYTNADGTKTLPSSFGDIKITDNPFIENAVFDNTTSENSSFDQVFEYMEIPMIAKYRLLNRKVRIFLQAGLTNNFLVGNRVMMKYNNSNIELGTTENVKSYYIGGIAGISLQYRVRRSLWINIDPTFRHALESSSNESTNSIYPFSFALYSGVSFQF